MAWIFAAVVLILAVRSRGFRKVLVWCCGVAILGLGGWYGWDRASERVRSSRVKPADVGIELPLVSKSQFGGWSLTARVRNKSFYTITEMHIGLSARDCEVTIISTDELARQSGGYLSTDPKAGTYPSTDWFAAIAAGQERKDVDLSKCDSVGMSQSSTALDIPPGHVRDIELSFYFHPEPMFRKGGRDFEFSVSKVYAKK
jgi:hypothetical protein